MVKTAYVRWYERGKVNLLAFAEKVHMEDPIRFYSPEFQLYLKAAAKRFGTLNEMRALGYFNVPSATATAICYSLAGDAYSAAKITEGLMNTVTTVEDPVPAVPKVEIVETKPNIFVRLFMKIKRFFHSFFN